MLALFGLYQAARNYVRCLRWVARFNPATICLALAFVFLGTVGAMAQTVANAGPDQIVASGATVTLDGGGSTGSITYYGWIIADASAPHVPGFTNTAAKVVTFTAPTLAPDAEDVTLTFILEVRDSGGGIAFDGVTVTVEAPDAVADTTAPTGEFETAPATHDGKTPFDMAIVFSEPVTGFTIADVGPTALDFPPGTSGVSVRPTISNFRQDSTNELRYTFTVTPIAPYNFYLVSARKPPANFRLSRYPR